MAILAPSIRLFPPLTIQRSPEEPLEGEDRVTFVLAKQDWSECQNNPDQYIDPLIDLLADEINGDLGIEAARTLGRIGDPRAIEPLIEFIEKSTVRYVDPAVEALGKINDPRSIEALIALLSEPRTPLVSTIQEAVFQFGDPAIEPLIVAFQDTEKNPRIYARENIVKGLLQFNDSRIVDVLIVALDDPDSDVREEATSALGLIGDPRAIEPLKRVLETDDRYSPSHQDIAERSLQEIARKNDSSDAGDEQ